MDVVNYKESIKNITKWNDDGAVFGFIMTGDFSTDYIYEFYCAMEMLNDLSLNHKISIVPGEKGIHFSRKGGYKKKCAKFLIKNIKGDKILFQVCLGTEVYLNNSDPFRADISIQTGDASDTPSQDMVVLLHDAKYSNSKSGISLTDIKVFAMDIYDFNVPKSIVEKLTFSKFPFFQSNCLISNVSINRSRRNYAIERKVKQIGGFAPMSSKIEE